MSDMELPEVGEDVALPSLPTGWVWSKVGEIGTYQNGRAFSDREWGDAGRPIIRIQNLTGSGKSFNRFDGEVEEKHLVRSGDLLISWAATLGVFVWSGEESALNQHIFKVISFVDRDYHRYVLEWALDEMMRNTHGSGMVHITKGKFDATLIPLPPVAEQQRIVGELERRLSHVDQAVAGLRISKVRVRDAKRSLLVHLTTTEWPEHWLRSTVADAGDSRLGLQRSPNRHSGSNMKPYLKVANVFDDRIDLAEVMEMHFTSEEEERYRLLEDDILLNEGQSPEWLGRPAVWMCQVDEMYFTNSLIRFRCKKVVDPRWALLVFRSHMYSGRFQRESRITTNIAHLALGRLKTVEFPIPPLDEQVEIAIEMERKLSLLEAADRAIDAGLAKAEQLRRSLLIAAFSGKLVPQDPKDEPAEVLLEEIRAEREAAAAAAKAAKAATKTTKKPAARKTSARKKETQP